MSAADPTWPALSSLCGTRAGTKQQAYRCTRPLGHGGDHIAGIGPWTPGQHILARWRQGGAVYGDDLGVDTDGAPLPLGGAEVRAIVAQMIDEGDIMAAIIRAPNGEIAVQVFGPPSTEMLEVLEAATRGYRAALEHRGGVPGPKGKPA